MNRHILHGLGCLLLGASLWACGKSENADNMTSQEGSSGGYSSPGAPTMEAERTEAGYAEDSPMTDSTASAPDPTALTRAEGFLSSSAAVASKDSTKQFVRTADLRYRVEDVRSATLHAEAVIGHFDGWVSHTNLQSEIVRTNVTPVSADSSLEETFFVVRNDMLLRVPQANLDTTLKTLSKLISYLDYRIIGAEDISLKMMFEALRQKRNEGFDRRVGNAIDDKGNKLSQIADAEERRLRAQESADAALMRRLEIADQVKYSTISLHIYQREAVRRDVIPNYKNIDAYRPGFFQRAGEAIASGWSGFLNLVLGLLHAWPLLLLILVVAVYGVMRWRKSRKQ